MPITIPEGGLNIIPSVNSPIEEIFGFSREGFIMEVFVTTPGRDRINLRSLGYTSLISSFYLEESVNCIDMLEIEFFNADRTDNQLFAQGNIIDIKLGYLGLELTSYNGFRITNTDFIYTINGYRIKVECMGKAVELSASERRRVYPSPITHSQIVENIASIYKLTAVDTIDATTTQFEDIVQANESDYCFIKNLAMLNGFIFYIENNRLHFHKLRSNSSPRHNNNIIIGIGEGRDIVKDLKVSVQGYGKNLNVKKNALDRFSGDTKGFTGESTSLLTEGLDPSQLEDRLIFDSSLQRDTFIEYPTLKDRFSEIRSYLDSKRYFGEFLIKACVRVKGVERLRAKRLINLEGIGRFSGLYFVTDTCHSFRVDKDSKSISNYETEFTCYKKFSKRTSELISLESQLDSDLGTSDLAVVTDDSISERSVSVDL